MDATQARQHYENCLQALYIQRDVGRMAEFYTADIVAHPLPPGVPPGLQGLGLMTQGFLAAFTELSFRIESCIQDGDGILCHYVVDGMHSGSFVGIPATGRRIQMEERMRLRFEQGRIAEYWSTHDITSLLRQLGVPAAA